MDHALGTSFQNYSRNPRRNNTVPGQFSEWLHGETLVNKGMMLSPWFPPRYLWAAIEGAAGLDLVGRAAARAPRLAPDWQWLGVQNLPYRGGQRPGSSCARPICRCTPTSTSRSPLPTSPMTRTSPRKCTSPATRRAPGAAPGRDLILFAGNTEERTITTAVRVADQLPDNSALRVFDSLVGQWVDRGLVPAAILPRGIAMQIERKGFWVLDLCQET